MYIYISEIVNTKHTFHGSLFGTALFSSIASLNYFSETFNWEQTESQMMSSQILMFCNEFWQNYIVRENAV